MTDVDRALEAGLPADVIAVLAAARLHWRQANADGRPVGNTQPASGDPVGPEVYWAGLDEALRHPLAPRFDEVFVAAMRRERGLR